MSALPLLSRGGRSDEIRGVAAMTRDVCRARGPGLWRCPRRPAAARQPLLYAVLMPVGALRRATTGLGKRGRPPGVGSPSPVIPLYGRRPGGHRLALFSRLNYRLPAPPRGRSSGLDKGRRPVRCLAIGGLRPARLSPTRAAYIYQHRTSLRDKMIADEISRRGVGLVPARCSSPPGGSHRQTRRQRAGPGVRPILVSGSGACVPD
jgi:hypothetical protein